MQKPDRVLHWVAISVLLAGLISLGLTARLGLQRWNMLHTWRSTIGVVVDNEQPNPPRALYRSIVAFGTESGERVEFGNPFVSRQARP
jgi:hypothetical protein